MYIIRLDDASDYADTEKWNRIEQILDKYDIKPIVGIIPQNEDDSLVKKYIKNNNFWKKALNWQEKKWIIAMHGVNHKYVTEEGGINPVQKRSEFAGLPLQVQKNKIIEGIKILHQKKIYPKVFFAPSHTFDYNTIQALKEESDIRIISDTVANDIYYNDEFYFIPEQSGRVRNLPFRVVTFCYHPNEMIESDFLELENFIIHNKDKFKKLDLNNLPKRKKSIIDKLLSTIYFLRRKI